MDRINNLINKLIFIIIRNLEVLKEYKCKYYIKKVRIKQEDFENLIGILFKYEMYNSFKNYNLGNKKQFSWFKTMFKEKMTQYIKNRLMDSHKVEVIITINNFCIEDIYYFLVWSIVNYNKFYNHPILSLYD